MKRIVFLLFVFSALFVAAQNRSSIETRALMQAYNKAKHSSSQTFEQSNNQTLLSRYPLRYDKEGNICIGVTAKVDSGFDADLLESYGVKVTSRVASIVAMRVPLDKLHLLENAPGIVSYSVAHRVAPMMDNARVDTRTDSVHQGMGVPMPFDGEGVLIGITDWGFDYIHPNLNRANNMRIEAAWDHFKLSGPAPDGFDYGTEYGTPEAVRAAKSDTSGLYGYGTHGTHVAGICGGLGTTDGHVVGQAPGAHYILGSWYLDEPSWLDQVAWMSRKAKEAGKRLVINSSWGMYTFSTLDGTSHLDEALNAYADSGIVFVTSAGNNGDANFHIQHTFGSDDTLRSVASYLASGIGEALIYWGEPADSNAADNTFSAAFALVNKNTGETTCSPFFSTADDIDYLESFVVTASGDTVGFDIMVESSNPFDSRPHVLLNVAKNNAYRLVMLCTAAVGTTVNVWNVGNVSNNAGNTGCDFVANASLGCVGGDNSYGISEPACAEKVVTVAAHSSDRYAGSDYVVGDIAYFSSLGPTLDGRNKPDVSAPGVSVVSSISSFCDNMSSYTSVYSQRSGGRNFIWSTMSGTSMSSPNVTGIVALMLQANPHISVDQIRDILFRTARNDRYTGPLQECDSVSPVWGHGKADALRAVSAAYDLLSVEEAAKVSPTLVVYPSPASSHITVATGSNEPRQVSVYAADGRRAMQFEVAMMRTVDVSALPKGIYIVHVLDPTGTRTAKFVK